MSLVTKKTRIDAKRVAEIIGCSRRTVLKPGAGTAHLTRIRNGSCHVRFILEEVMALKSFPEPLVIAIQSNRGIWIFQKDL